MNKKIIIILFGIVLCILSTVYLLTDNTKNQAADIQNYEEYFKQSGFSKSFEEAKKLANIHNKPILTFFHASWCPFSGKTIEDIFLKNQYKKILNHFVLLQLDMEMVDYAKIKDTYRVYGTNLILFLNSNGDEIARIYGDSLENSGKEILNFFANLKNRKKPFEPKLVKSKALLKAVVAPMLKIDKSGEKKYTDRAHKYINVFKESYPSIDLREIEANIRLTSAKNNGNLHEFIDFVVNDFKDPEWMLRIANSKFLDKKAKTRVLEKTVKVLRNKISIEKNKQIESSELKLYYELLQIAYDYGADIDVNSLWLEYEKYIEQNGEKRSHLVFLSHAWSWEKNFKSSLKNYDKLLKFTPHLVSMRVRKAKVLLDMDKNEEVISSLKKVLPETYGENRFKAYYLLSIAFTNLGKMNQAKQFLIEGQQYGKKTYQKDVELFTHYKQLSKALEQLKNL